MPLSRVHGPTLPFQAIAMPDSASGPGQGRPRVAPTAIRDHGLSLPCPSPLTSPPCPSPNQRSWPLTSVPIAESEIMASHLRAHRRIRDHGLSPPCPSPNQRSRSPPCPSPNQRSWPLTWSIAESEITASHLRAAESEIMAPYPCPSPNHVAESEKSWCLWSKFASTHRPRVWSRRGDRPVAPLSSVPSGSRKIEPLRFARPRNMVSSMHGGRQ